MRRCFGCMREFDDALDVCPHCGYAYNNTSVKRKNHLCPGTMLQNRYMLGKVLGQGGFGITYIAWDQRLEKPVAIKEYFPTSFVTRTTGQRVISCINEDSQKYFESGLQKMLNESRMLARFADQKHIVQVLDCFEENGTAYIVMEYLRGETLQSTLSRERKIPLDRTLQIIFSVLQALDAIHQTGLIHRDVSPDNLFICQDGTVKLLDFGAAREVGGLDHKTLSVMLKKGFAPVEQYSSHGKQGPYTDVYAVCATMYKMLTGITPQNSLDRMTEDKLRPIAEQTPIPDSIEQIIRKGMAVTAADRIQSAGELYQALQDAFREEQENPTIPDTESVDDTGSERFSSGTLKKIIIVLVALILVVSIAFVVIIGLRTAPAESAETSNTESDNENLPQTSMEWSATSSFEVGDTVKFGTFEQDGNADNGEEEIEWLVIDAAANGESFLLLSRYALDCRPYDETYAPVTWEDCQLREWLNDAFYTDHFTDEEKEQILQTQSDNPDNDKYSTTGGAQTTDHFFLLSLTEAETLDPKYRTVRPTVNAVSRGAFQNEETGSTWWMLRSPGSGNDLCAIVRSDGEVRAGGEKVDVPGAVRPAMWIAAS